MTDDDYHRSEAYHSPVRAFMRKQLYTRGCGCCIHTHRTLTGRWECLEKIEGYPYHSDKSCERWDRKKR